MCTLYNGFEGYEVETYYNEASIGVGGVYRLLYLGVYHKQKRTMRNFENVYRYENSCKDEN